MRRRQHGEIFDIIPKTTPVYLAIVNRMPPSAAVDSSPVASPPPINVELARAKIEVIAISVSTQALETIGFCPDLFDRRRMGLP